MILLFHDTEKKKSSEIPMNKDKESIRTDSLGYVKVQKR